MAVKETTGGKETNFNQQLDRKRTRMELSAMDTTSEIALQTHAIGRLCL
jgi:hypothetical protein